MSRQPITRREFLRRFTTPLDAAIELFVKLRSENPDRPDGVKLADQFAEYGSEAALLIVAIQIGIEAGKDKLYTIQVKPAERISDKPSTLETMQAPAIALERNWPEASNSLAALDSAWSSAYHKTRVVSDEDCSGSGEDRKCTTTLKTEYYWDEPSSLTRFSLNNKAITNWFEFVSDISGKLSHLKNRLPQIPTYQWGIESYRFATQTLDQGTQTTSRMIGFGASALAYALYEEIYSLVREEGVGRNATGLSAHDIKRRAFLKLSAGTLAAREVNHLQQRLVVQNSSLDQRVRAFTQQTINSLEAQPAQSFQRFMGTDVNGVVAKLDHIISVCQQVVGQDQRRTEDWSSIGPKVQSLLAQAQSTRDNFVAQTGYRAANEFNLSPGLVQAMNHVWVDDTVQAKVQQENTYTNVSALVQIGAFAGILTGTALAGELLLKASDNVINRMQTNSYRRR